MWHVDVAVAEVEAEQGSVVEAIRVVEEQDVVEDFILIKVPVEQGRVVVIMEVEVAVAQAKVAVTEELGRGFFLALEELLPQVVRVVGRQQRAAAHRPLLNGRI